MESGILNLRDHYVQIATKKGYIAVKKKGG